MKRDPSINEQNKDRILQLEQKVLRYKSEAAHFQAKMKEMEQQLKKEQTRIQYLQTKLTEAQTKNIDNYESKISDLEHKLIKMEVELEEEKNQANTLLKKAVEEAKKQQVEPIHSFQAYFSHSFILPEEDEHHVSIIGDFIITNTGNTPLHNLVVLLRISPKEAGRLSGKIIMNRKKERLSYREASFLQWEFVHENWMEKVKETGEYWIKPLGINELLPQQSITFSNFEARLKKPKDKNVAIIEGFMYCKEIQSGQKALNQIVINF